MADCLIEQRSMDNCFLSNQCDNSNSLCSLNANDQSQKNINKPKFIYNLLNQFKYAFQKVRSMIFYIKEEKINYRHVVYFILFAYLLLYIFIDELKSEKRKSVALYDNKYQIEIMKYNILYDINKDSSINVTENITISYQGTLNTGFRRYIPIDNGVQIRKVQIHQITDNGIQKVHHNIYLDWRNIVFDIGDYRLKYGKNESYFITYELLILNKTFQKTNMMPLNVIGHEWDCKINNAKVQLYAPSGLIETKCYVGYYGTTKEYKKFSINQKNDKKVISISIDHLNKYEGVTFNLHFQPKTIDNYVDFSCISYIIILIITLLVIFAFSFHAKNKNKIIPVRYTSALNTLDPLVMSKVVNGSVNKSDVPSIIFYWASKGFLNINFDDENDPILIKKVDSIPDSYPQYQAYMFDKLFQKGEVVKTLELKYKFYKTINEVIDMVDNQTNKFDNFNSIVLSFVFASFAVFWSIIVPIRSKKLISEEFDFNNQSYFFGILQVVVWFVRYLISYKYIVNSDYFTLLIIIVISSVFSCYLYISSIPDIVVSVVNKYALSVLSEICVMCSTYVITKTVYFKAKINEVYGFKEFIEHPVNEEFESFLKKDPELFYNFICYAQVLDLSDQWKHKFDSLTVSPPHWIVRSNFNNYYINDYIWMHRRIIFINNSMVDNMVHSPPQENSHSYGSSSHSFGGGGGGFGGGGFGGGGGCGR